MIATTASVSMSVKPFSLDPSRLLEARFAMNFMKIISCFFGYFSFDPFQANPTTRRAQVNTARPFSAFC